MCEVRRRSGAEVECLGVVEDGAIVAGAALEIHRSRLSTFAEVHDGPLCDLADEELARFFFSELAARAKAAGAAQLSITPELPYRVRDGFGRELPPAGELPAGVPANARRDAASAEFALIEGAGFIHSGFDRDYNAIPRWRYVKDLSGIGGEQELLASYSKNTRRDIRIAESSFITVSRAERADMADFHAICQLSSDKQGFDNRPLAYFELLFDCMGDSADFMIARMDTAAYLASCEEKRSSFAEKVERIEAAIAAGGAPEKNRRRLADAQEQLQGVLKRIDEARALIERDGESAPVAAAMFVRHPRECVYLFSGSNPAYGAFCAPSAIQHRMLADSLARGIRRYNFYGINGVFDDPGDPGRGLLEFKQGFNGYVEEMMGSFTLPVRPLAYAAKQLAHKVLGR